MYREVIPVSNNEAESSKSSQEKQNELDGIGTGTSLGPCASARGRHLVGRWPLAAAELVTTTVLLRGVPGGLANQDG